MPTHLCIADVYFFDELSTRLSRLDAEAWLASTIARGASADSSGRTTPSTCSTCPSGYTSPHILPTHVGCKSIADGCSDFKQLSRTHGARAGLLFTDAAHQLLDSTASAPAIRSTCMRQPAVPPRIQTDSSSFTPSRARGLSPTMKHTRAEQPRLGSWSEERASMPRLTCTAHDVASPSFRQVGFQYATDTDTHKHYV